MAKWLVSRVIDLLIVFILVTILLGWAASHYPEFFPKSFHAYWGAVTTPAK